MLAAVGRTFPSAHIRFVCIRLFVLKSSDGMELRIFTKVLYLSSEYSRHCHLTQLFPLFTTFMYQLRAKVAHFHNNSFCRNIYEQFTFDVIFNVRNRYIYIAF